MTHLLSSIHNEIGIVGDFLHGDKAYWMDKFNHVLGDIEQDFDGEFISSYILEKNEEDDIAITIDINGDLQNMLRHIYEPCCCKWKTDFRFKNIKLHNVLEHISDSSVLIDTYKQYVIRVIKNEIDTEHTHILRCPKCLNNYMNVRNPIMPLCIHHQM